MALRLQTKDIAVLAGSLLACLLVSWLTCFVLSANAHLATMVCRLCCVCLVVFASLWAGTRWQLEPIHHEKHGRGVRQHIAAGAAAFLLCVFLSAFLATSNASTFFLPWIAFIVLDAALIPLAEQTLADRRVRLDHKKLLAALLVCPLVYIVAIYALFRQPWSSVFLVPAALELELVPLVILHSTSRYFDNEAPEGTARRRIFPTALQISSVLVLCVGAALLVNLSGYPYLTSSGMLLQAGLFAASLASACLLLYLNGFHEVFRSAPAPAENAGDNHVNDATADRTAQMPDSSDASAGVHEISARATVPHNSTHPSLSHYAVRQHDDIEARCTALGQLYDLSQREVDVVVLLANKTTRADMADILNISTNTVNTHVKHLYSKLGIHSRDDLMEMLGEVF